MVCAPALVLALAAGQVTPPNVVNKPSPALVQLLNDAGHIREKRLADIEARLDTLARQLQAAQAPTVDPRAKKAVFEGGRLTVRSQADRLAYAEATAKE